MFGMLHTFYPCSFPLRESPGENFALIFIRSQGLNGGIMLPTFHTYFHSWSVWVYSRYERNISVTVGRQAIKMFPLAHAFVIIWWKFTASADVSTGKMNAMLVSRLGGRDSKVNLLSNVNMQLHWISGAICAPLCSRSMLKRDLS